MQNQQFVQYSQQDSSSVINEINNRVRLLENKQSLVRDRMLIINQNMIDEYKKLMIEIRTINSDIKEIKSDLFTIKETIHSLVKELDSFAKKENVKVLEKYINLWNPLNFVTEKQVLELIKSVKKSGKHKKRTSHR